MPELVRYRTKPTQSSIFLVWYRTELVDAGMPMPALFFLMPMPSYALLQKLEVFQYPLPTALKGNQ
jgi:hypothetical protein